MPQKVGEEQKPIRANPFINPQPSIEAAEHLVGTAFGRQFSVNSPAEAGIFSLYK